MVLSILGVPPAAMRTAIAASASAHRAPRAAFAPRNMGHNERQ